jgi:hypothetical protein
MWRLLLMALVGVMLLPRTARAEPYEWERTRKLLERERLELAEVPEGKRIAYVRVVRDDVFVEDEIWPPWFNYFHWMTKDHVVRRELLLTPGESFVDARAEESMRNLRGMGIFALVRIVAVKTDRPEEVGVIVHTRDVWSLRLEQDFNVTTQINYLLLRLIERNMLGRNQQVGTDFTLVPKTYTIGQSYYGRRIANSAFSVEQTGGIIFNRERNEAEGSTFSASVGRPIYSLGQRWGFSMLAEYTTRVTRHVRDGQVLIYRPVEDGPYAVRAWREKELDVSAGGALRRGTHFMHTFEAGWDVRDLRALPNAETSLDPELRQDFIREVLPKQRTEVGPYLSYVFFVPRYQIFSNLGTYGQSENVRVGPSLSLATRIPVTPFGSTTNSAVGLIGASLTLAPLGGLIQGSVETSGRYEQGKVVDQLVSAILRGATPIFSVFRLVARVGLNARRRDTSRQFVALGGNNGLRGHVSQALVGYGDSAAVANLELRTLPIEWQALHVGAVLFYDVGSVYERLDQLRASHAVGIGLRILFPQFSRYPFAFDAGAPLDPGFRIVPTIQAGQVVPMTAVEDVLAD